MKSNPRKELFLEMSAFLVGFKPIDLLVTDLLDTYVDELLIRVGENNFDWLLHSWESVKNEPLEFQKLWTDERAALILRNIIKLWYTGTWKVLPASWVKAYGESIDPKLNFEHVVSAQGYQEGLVWEVLGAHPPGAKAPGFGSWSEPPKSIVKAKSNKNFPNSTKP